jgi:hypothetical protein
LEIERKSFGFFSFLLPIVRSCQKTQGCFVEKLPLIIFVMSFWDWLLAAWIYEEIFDDDSGDRLRDNTCDYDSSCDYDDYEEDF